MNIKDDTDIKELQIPNFDLKGEIERRANKFNNIDIDNSSIFKSERILDVIALLYKYERLRPRDIANIMNIEYQRMWAVLERMIKRGLLKKINFNNIAYVSLNKENIIIKKLFES